MKVLSAIGVVILLVLLAGPVSLRLRTVEQIKRIEALKGQVGILSDLAKPIRARYQLLESGQQLELALAKLGMPVVSATNVLVARFNGEGLPYFWGYVAYETNAHKVVEVKVEQLW